MTSPQRGEVWLVDLNPTRGQEIQKICPVVVISSDIFSPIPLRIIIPITSWQAKFSDRPFMARIEATEENGLVETQQVMFYRFAAFQLRVLLDA